MKTQKHLVNENKGKEETSKLLDDSEIINFTINKSNVYNESKALATTNTNKQEKVDIVNKQMETRTEQEYTRLAIARSKQQHEFNNKTEAEQIRITDELNQVKATISSYEIETQIIVMRREIERGLKDELSTFKEKFELSFKNEQKVLEAHVGFLKSENSSLKLQIHLILQSEKIPRKYTENALKTITET